jgi:hypothetical protein
MHIPVQVPSPVDLSASLIAPRGRNLDTVRLQLCERKKTTHAQNELQVSSISEVVEKWDSAERVIPRHTGNGTSSNARPARRMDAICS